MIIVEKGLNKFYVGDSENNYTAVITYSFKQDKTISADHTFVSEEARGQGIAKALLNALVSWARSEGLKIIPECEYVKKVMTNDAAYADVLKMENNAI